jgi:C_GCAxxG_C_C family probable redox protein
VGLEKINKYDENVIASIGAFGGGIASSGSVCGTLLGAVAAVSSLHSRGNLEEKENPRMWGASHKLINQFDQLTEQYAGRNCRDIAGVNWSDRDEVKNYYKNPDSTRKDCIRLVGELAFILGTILEKEMARLENT